MKVCLIGTSSIYCKENSASTLLNSELLIDIPNGCHKQLLKMGYDVSKIKAVVITHLHGDHFADIAFILAHRSRIGLKEKLIIITPNGGKNQILKLLDVYNFDFEWKTIVEIIEVEKSIQEFEIINKYKIKAIEVSHGKFKPAYGYIVNNAVGFTGDSKICDGVETIIENVKFLIADTSHIIGSEAHMGVDNIKYLANKYPNTTIISTHMSNDSRTELKKEKISNVIIPDDGYIFEI